jgi:hypothetical protein
MLVTAFCDVVLAGVESLSHYRIDCIQVLNKLALNNAGLEFHLAFIREQHRL